MFSALEDVRDRVENGMEERDQSAEERGAVIDVVPFAKGFGHRVICAVLRRSRRFGLRARVFPKRGQGRVFRQRDLVAGLIGRVAELPAVELFAGKIRFSFWRTRIVCEPLPPLASQRTVRLSVISWTVFVQLRNASIWVFLYNLYSK